MIMIMIVIMIMMMIIIISSFVVADNLEWNDRAGHWKGGLWTN